MGQVTILRPWAGPATATEAEFGVSIFVSAHILWLRERGLAESTIHARELALSRLARAVGGVPLCELTRHQLAEWRAGLRTGPNAISGEIGHAAEFFRWLLREGLRDDDPTADLVRPQLPKRLPRPVGLDQALAALAAAPSRIRPWLVLAGWAGMRAKEIALLRRERVLDSAPVPAILIAADATKGRRERLIPMTDFLQDEIVPILPRSGWVFRRLDGQPGPITPRRLSNLANSYLSEIGLQVTLHQWRHTFGTQHYAAGLDIRATQEVMGHASPATTAPYVQVASADALRIMQAMPAPGRLRAVSE